MEKTSSESQSLHCKFVQTVEPVTEKLLTVLNKFVTKHKYYRI